MSSRQSRSPVQLFPLTSLPDLPLDKVIHYLDAEDLRRFHQVCSGWRAVLESRTKDNKRRLELVEKIREDQENIARGPINKESLPAGVVAFRAVREQRMLEVDPKKMDSPVLMECTNQFENTPTSDISRVSIPDYSNSLTPLSRFAFQDFEDAEKSLEPGQKLFQCRRCRGPVPSPVSSNGTGESRRNSTRCKLITKLQLKDYDYQLESPEKNVSKKARTLSAADFSPIPYSPPVTVASLSEKMTQSLVLSSPCLSTSTSHVPDQIGTSTPRVDIKRSTSCSSIEGIDLHLSKNRERSPIDLSLNLNSFDTSGIGLSNIELLSEKSCRRSCCRVPDMHTSQFSDSGFSHDSEANTAEIELFSHWIPSPVAPVAPAEFLSHNYDNNSIERARNTCNNSSGVLSISSFHLQRSDQNLSVGNSVVPAHDNSIPTLECPNPTCKYRFCSNCEEGEHPERSCRLLSSDNLESFYEISGNNSENYIKTSQSIISDGSRDSGKSKISRPKHKHQKKSALKRLARLKQD